jgi:hypothetical protein
MAAAAAGGTRLCLPAIHNLGHALRTVSLGVVDTNACQQSLGRNRLIAPSQSGTAQCARLVASNALSRRRRRQTLVDELLNAIAPRFTRHEIAARIHSEAGRMIELAGLAPGAVDLADLLERRAIENGNALVGAVGDVTMGMAIQVPTRSR